LPITYSRRLHWTTPRNRLATLLAARRAARAPLLDLTGTNPTQAGFEYPAREILQALTHPGALTYDPSAAGLPQAREAVAGYYADLGFNVHPERILLTASTSEAYSFLFKLLCDPGCSVLPPRPSYPLFDYLARLELCRLSSYPLHYDGAWSPVPELADTTNARAWIAVSPNNPTGSYLKQHEPARFHAAAPLPIICDEVFTCYALREDPSRIHSMAGQDTTPSFSLSGLSKICGLPQMKLGWIVASGEGASDSMARLELIADTFLSASAPVQYASVQWLALRGAVQSAILSRARENLAILRRLAGPTSPLTLLDAEGGWTAVLRIPGSLSDEERVYRLLDQDNVLLQPGYFYDFDGGTYVVVSLLTRPGHLEEGITRLLRRVSDT